MYSWTLKTVIKVNTRQVWEHQEDENVLTLKAYYSMLSVQEKKEHTSAREDLQVDVQTFQKDTTQYIKMKNYENKLI